MSSGTIGGMKVLAVKGIEKQGNLWAVRYTYETARGVPKGGMFLCDTPEEAKAKYRELLDVLLHQNGVYIGSKAKRKLKASSRKPAG
jgi:hypothetical protein